MLREYNNGPTQGLYWVHARFMRCTMMLREWNVGLWYRWNSGIMSGLREHLWHKDVMQAHASITKYSALISACWNAGGSRKRYAATIRWIFSGRHDGVMNYSPGN